MSTFSAKGSDIDVEAIMANIRRRIDEKRKGLYTEDEVKEIAEMQLDAVLDSHEFNSDFVAAFRARDERWNYTFGPETIYTTSRGGFIAFARKLLNPVLKLFFNPNPVISALSRQSDLNRYYVLLLHNMSQELTRMNLELSNLKARLRTLGIRVDFQTKREKTFEKLSAAALSNRPARDGEARESRDNRGGRDGRGGRGGRDRDRDRDRDSRQSRGRGQGQGQGQGQGGQGQGQSQGQGTQGRDGSSDRDSRGRGRGRGRGRSMRRRRGGSGGGGGGGGGRPNENRGGGKSSPSGPRDGSGGSGS